MQQDSENDVCTSKTQPIMGPPNYLTFLSSLRSFLVEFSSRLGNKNDRHVKKHTAGNTR